MTDDLRTYTVHLTHVVSTSRTVQAKDVDAAIDGAQNAPDLPTPAVQIVENYDADGEWEPWAVETDGVEVWSRESETEALRGADHAVLEDIERKRDKLRAQVTRLRATPAPDAESDGVEVWLIADGLDVERDATGHGDPTYRVGGREVPAARLCGPRDALTAALDGPAEQEAVVADQTRPAPAASGTRTVSTTTIVTPRPGSWQGVCPRHGASLWTAEPVTEQRHCTRVDRMHGPACGRPLTMQPAVPLAPFRATYVRTVLPGVTS